MKKRLALAVAACVSVSAIYGGAHAAAPASTADNTTIAGNTEIEYVYSQNNNRSDDGVQIAGDASSNRAYTYSVTGPAPTWADTDRVKPLGIVEVNLNGKIDISNFDAVNITAGEGDSPYKHGISARSDWNGGSEANTVRIHNVNSVNITTTGAGNAGIYNVGGLIQIEDVNDISINADQFAVYASPLKGNGSVDRDADIRIKADNTATINGRVHVNGSQGAGATASASIEGKTVSITHTGDNYALSASGRNVGGSANLSVKAEDALNIQGDVALSTSGDTVKASIEGKTVTLNPVQGNALYMYDSSQGQKITASVKGETISIGGAAGAASIANNGGVLNIEQTGEQGSISIDKRIISGMNGVTNLSAEGDTSQTAGNYYAYSNGTLNFQKGTWTVNTWAGEDGNISVQDGATLAFNQAVAVAKVELADNATVVVDTSKVTDNVITVTDASNSSVGTNTKMVLNNVDTGLALQLIGISDKVTDQDEIDKAKALNAVVQNNVSTNSVMQDVFYNKDTNQYEVKAADAGKVFSGSVLRKSLEAAVAANDNRFDPFVKIDNTDEAKAKAAARLNAAANIAELGGAAHSTYAISGIWGDALARHTIKTDSEVWARAFHSKDQVDGMGLAGMAASYDGQYNGAVAGVDFYQKEGRSLGAAILYADGNVSGADAVSYTKNEADFWGLALYGRMEKETYRLVGDLSYLGGSHDILQRNGDTTITATPDTEALSLGVRAEKDYIAGAGVLTPYAGLRYLRLTTDSYTSSLGLHYDSADQDLFLLPVGADYHVNLKKGNWTLRPHVGLGYVWTLGDRRADTMVSYMQGADALSYDTADAGSLLLSAGIEAENGSTALGIGYSWQKGSTVDSQTWNIHVGYRF